MKTTFALLTLAAALMGCVNQDATEQAVMSDKPMSEYTGKVTEDLNTRQTNDVSGMEQGGVVNQYEEEQMESAIGTTK